MPHPKKNDYLIRTPVHRTLSPAEAQALRRDTRAAHLAYARPLIDAGVLVWGGPSLARHPEDGDEPEEEEVTGSVMCFRAESEEAVRRLVARDPFAERGLWDVQGAVVVAMRCVVGGGGGS